jgi:hypothetical protein
VQFDHIETAMEPRVQAGVGNGLHDETLAVAVEICGEQRLLERLPS